MKINPYLIMTTMLIVLLVLFASTLAFKPTQIIIEKEIFVSDRVEKCLAEGGEYFLLVDAEWGGDKCKVDKVIEL